MAKAAIKYEGRFHGNVQKLIFREPTGHKVEVVALLPGHYYLGIAKCSETVEVVRGTLIHGGVSFLSKGTPCRLRAGDRKAVSCNEPTVYLCHYVLA